MTTDANRGGEHPRERMMFDEEQQSTSNEQLADTYPVPEHGWVCFHCGEHFPSTLEGQHASRLHFGPRPTEEPMCGISASKYRMMLENHRRHCAEDTELHRALHAKNADMQAAVRLAEEQRYARGLDDAKKRLCVEKHFEGTHCPFTRRPYFMHVDHPELGRVPTYGGPFDASAMAEDAILELQARRASQPPIADWQPIETAPHDTLVLVLPAIGHACESYYDSASGVWRCMDGRNGRMTSLVTAPTCWMPMP